MAAVLSEILVEKNQQAIFYDLMSNHLKYGVPTVSWLDTTNVGLSLTHLVAEELFQVREVVRTIAKSMFLDDATEDGLTMLGKSQYGLDRVLPSFAIGKMVLSSVASAPKYIFTSGQLVAGTLGDNGILFTNVQGGTLNSGGTLTLDFQAKKPGLSGNLPNNVSLDLKTSFPGVSISNPIYKNGTWLIQVGTDGRSDELFKTECDAKWGTIGAECNEQAMVYWALRPPRGYPSSPVSQVRVMSNFLKHGYWPGAVTIIIGNDQGPLPIGDVVAVTGNFEYPQKYGIGRQLEVLSLQNLDVFIDADINIYKTANVSESEIRQSVENSIADYQKLIKIGQILYPQKIGARLEDANKLAIRDINLGAPLMPIIPLYYERPHFILRNISCNWV